MKRKTSTTLSFPRRRESRQGEACESSGYRAGNWLRRGLFLILSLAMFIVLIGCQGGTSTDPPIHINPNMDNQPKYIAQSKSEFFRNGAAMRVPPKGTIPRGELVKDPEFELGLTENGAEVTAIPMELTGQDRARGKARFEIYCNMCHGDQGDGDGIVIEKGFMKPPSFHDDKVKNFTDGYIYGVISNGVRNMPAYGEQIPPKDRWRIVSYVRQLQGE